MEFPSELAAVEGAKILFDWFGYWPSFHDAEVVRLKLDRSDKCDLAVHTWEMTGEVDSKGFFVLRKHVVVEFLMNQVQDLNLTGFNQQNVLSGLALENITTGYRLVLHPCYGIAGTIDTKEISIRLAPGKPQDSE